MRRLLPAISLIAVGLAACPMASNKPKPNEAEGAQATPADGGAAVAAVDGGTAELPDIIDADGGGADEQHEADAAAKSRAKEEAELKAKDAQRKADAEKLKAVQDKLNGVFSEAFKSVKTGKDDEAIATYQKVIADQPEAFAAHYNLGVLYERKGERDKAVAEYQEALKLKSDFDPASDNLSRLYLRAGDSARAESELRQRILAYPRNLAFRNQLVRVMMAEGRFDQAESDSKKILKLDERNVDAMMNLANIWYGQKKFELSKQVLEAARDILNDKQANSKSPETDPYAPAVWNLLAFTQLNLDQRAFALDSFKKAAELRPDFPEAHNNYGAMLNEVNDCDGAAAQLETAVRYAPDYAEAHLNLGNAYRCGHHYKEAQAEYEKALSLNQKSTDPIFNIAILYLDGFDMHVPFDEKNVLDSEKLERLNIAIKYFDQYKSAGGNDDRFDRYYAEAQKTQSNEAKRLARVQESGIKANARKARDEARKIADAEKAKALSVKNMAEVAQYKVTGKADFEDDQKGVPAPAAAPASAPAVPPPAVLSAPHHRTRSNEDN